MDEWQVLIDRMNDHNIKGLKMGLLMIDAINLIADKLDDYKNQIEEKDAIIKRLLESEK